MKLLSIFNKRIITQAFKSDEQIITAIHSEMDSAQERLLQEAKNIIEHTDDRIIEKSERLSKLGFNRSKEAMDGEILKNEREQSLKVSKAILKYKQSYPFNKFITENEVKRICKKYGIVCGNTFYYKGSIPDKNIKEIESFKLNEEDMDKHEFGYYRYLSNGYFTRTFEKTTDYGYCHNYNTFERKDESLTHEYVKKDFKICASIKDFDTTLMRVEDGYILANIPDPIVLQPVEHGYLIVSKWGIEANDEATVNEINN